MTRAEWPAAAAERLKTLWRAGHTASKIAAELNAGYGLTLTRNAVVGKVHRLGLDGRPSPIKPGKPSRLPRKPTGVSVTKGVAPKPAPAREPETRLSEHHTCQWLEGERPHWQKCGRPSQAGFDWCPEHRARVYCGKKVRYKLSSGFAEKRRVF